MTKSSLQKNPASTSEPENEVIKKKGLKERQRFRVKMLFTYTWRAKKYFLPGFIVEGLATGVDLVAPILIGQILNRQVIDAAGTSGVDHYLRLLLFYFCAVFISAGLRYSSQVLFQYTANHVGRLIQTDVFSHLQALPLSFFDHMPAGKIVSRVTNDSNAVKMLYAQVVTRLITAGIYALGIYISLSLLDYRLFLLALIPLPLLYFVFKDFKSKSSTYNQSLRRSLSELNSQLNENIQGMEIIQSLGRENRVYSEFRALNDEHFETNVKYSKLFAYSTHNITDVLDTLVMAAILAYFGYASLSGKYDVPLGNLYVFIEYMRRLFEQFNTVMQRVGNLERSLGAADHIFELLQVEKADYISGELEEFSGNIEFSDVHFSYLEDEPVLKGISLRIEADSRVAFVGATGSGKSTIMNLLCGFYPLDSGKILIDGKDLTSLPLLSLRQKMAFVLQDPFLFKGTLYNNIALGDEKISPEKATRALLDVGGNKLLSRLEEGIMSPVGEHGQGYSTGERQLISFARALAKEPEILILDEATANVDSETEAIIQEGIARLQKDRTTLLIAHRLSTIKEADQIYVLDRGQIVESGTHESLSALGGIYAKMYEEQFGSVR